MIRFVTSMNLRQFEGYGMEMLKSFRLPGPDCEMRVYSEDELPIPYYPIFPDTELGRAMRQIMDYYSKLDVLHGRAGGEYYYQRNLFTFAFKAFSEVQAALDFTGYLYWVDADTLWDGQKSQEWYVNNLIGKSMVIMGRNKWHLCSSFVGWNMTHPETSRFFENYLNGYLSGSILTFPQWDDAGVIHYLINNLKIPYNNISPNDIPEGPDNIFDRVFIGVAKHRKGLLKRHPSRYVEILQAIAQEKPKRIIEIGTWNGDFGIAMCKAAGGADYVGFDLFEDATETSDREENNVKPHASIIDVAQKFTDAGIKAELYRGNTREALPRYYDDVMVGVCEIGMHEGTDGPESFDLAFIDGGHSVETIASDYAQVARLMKPGGMIVLDDYYEGEIDISKFGCNNLVSALEGKLSESVDPVKGGGTVRCFFMRT